MMARNNWDDDNLDQDALLAQLEASGGGTVPLGPLQGGPTSSTMPVTPMPPLPVGQPAATSSANAPRMTQANGVWTLNEHGNQRQLQANEVDGAQKYTSDFWAQNPTGFQAGNANSMNDAYRQFTGRDGDAAGLAAHAKNPGGFEGAINAIANSDEAKAYANRPQTILGGTTPPAGGATTPPAGGTRTPTTASVYKGFTPKYAMEGFDLQREQDTGKSAKDAFAFLANQAPPPPLNDKAKLGQWFTQYIQPGMNELGHNVSSVEGDKFRFKNWQGEYDVDFGRGAGAEGGALAWQATDANGTPQTQGTYTPRTNAGQRIDNNPMAREAAPAPAQTESADPMAAIMAEIQALQNGGGSPMEQDALLQLLGAV